jgi:hypothetical protein
MDHEQRGIVTRRAALALLPLLALATASPGCSPSGETSRGAVIPDRLKRMSALRGTGDPRSRGRRSARPAIQKARTQ